VEKDKDLKILTRIQINKNLKKLPGWKYGKNKIYKEFLFESFSKAVEFVSKLAPFFNKIDHHPDIHIFYKKILFELTRFSVGGKVTQRDFTDAKKIESEYKNFKPNTL
jgi:4a-hydroxytetrahydrobiopterin dehydratase